MEKFIALSISNLRLDDLAGLVSETLLVAALHGKGHDPHPENLL